MLVFNIGILIIFGVGYISCLRGIEEWIKNVDKKEHKLYILYPMANWLLTKTGLEKILNRKDTVNSSIKALYITSKPEILQKLFWCSRISLIIAILVLFDLLSLLGQLQAGSNSIIHDGRYLVRPSYGEGSSEVELKVTMEQTEAVDTSDKYPLVQSQDISINVPERLYSQDQLVKIFDEAIQYLKIDVLGKNESAEQIYENLHFCESIPGTSIMVEWKPETYSLIQMDGTVSNEAIDSKGVSTTVTAILSYREQQTEYSMSFQIMPKKYSEEEILRKKLAEKITVASERSAKESLLELPASLEDYRLSWKGKEESTGRTLLILGVLIASVVWVFGDKELEKQMRMRKEQMLLDYPEIINKFTLLVNAGMTVKQAWNKIATDYNEKSVNKQFKKRYAYEEMLTTTHELKLGLPESNAYEQYGRRIGLISYIKFSSLISQNLKKGNKGFTNLLMKEASEAFEDRKEIAKRLGEEAGTKLLMPMMIMLIIVFLIILIPAFWSFGS